MPFVTDDTFQGGSLARSADAHLDRRFPSCTPAPAILPGSGPLICPGASQLLPLKRGFKTVPGVQGSQSIWETLSCINVSEGICPQDRRERGPSFPSRTM